MISLKVVKITEQKGSREMSKKAFVIDSTLISDADEILGTDIYIQPLHVTIDGENYDDLTELDAMEFYAAYEEGAECLTSQPSPGEFVTTFEMLRDKGYTDILVFTISSGLSGTSNSARQGAELTEGVNVHVIDTKISGAVGVKVVKHLYAAALADPTLSIAAIIEKAEQIFATAKIFIYIGDLDALRKGGRLGAVGAALGKILQIKPIVSLLPDGSLDVVVKERTERKGLAKVIDLMEAQAYNHAMVLGTSNTELRDKLEQLLKAKHPELPYVVENISPVIGTHIGTEGTAIFIWEM